jgi:hypothetical protein
VSSDILGDPNISLVIKGHPYDWIVCSGDAAQTGAFSKLRAGQEVTMRGVGAGTSLGSPMLKECAIDNGEPTPTPEPPAKPSEDPMVVAFRIFAEQGCACENDACRESLKSRIGDYVASIQGRSSTAAAVEATKKHLVDVNRCLGLSMSL